MMSTLIKGLILGILSGIVGSAVVFLPIGRDLEENLGLEALFTARGAVRPPPQAVVVSIDKESSERLAVPDNPDKWPRNLHARLIENLVREGAKVISFDVHFVEPRSAEEDRLLAGALSKAGNVVLCEPIKAREIALAGAGNPLSDVHKVVQVVKPLDIFADNAVATAPFLLPRIPFKVSNYWTFQTGAGDVPSMPAVALQLYALPAWKSFLGILEKESPAEASKLPQSLEPPPDNLKELMMGVREMFQRDSSLAKRMRAGLRGSGSASAGAGGGRDPLVEALIGMYGGENIRYLDFYGPPRTVPTIPYYQALQLRDGEVEGRKLDVRGKAVFVGLSEILLAERKDSFYTVFSEAGGLFISGVEIMATAFSNLIADHSLVPVGTLLLVCLILFWGVAIAVVSRWLPIVPAAFTVLVLCVIYFIFAAFQFGSRDLWYPVVVPLLLQAPLSFFGAVVWNYVDTNKERRNITKAFEHYLPKDVVKKLARNFSQIQTGGEVVYGICLFTDAENYTTMSETMPPAELGRFMNTYYESMFKPVKENDGFVSGVIGDAMLALWVTAKSENEAKKKACLAALGIREKELELFRNAPSGETARLRTRVGLHCGHILLGNIGALDHYEYTPMGDIVNTASRIESLNKQLGTSLMVSDEMIHELDGFLSRDLGEFKLKGKLKPVRVHELMGILEGSDDGRKTACVLFGEAMDDFRTRAWDRASEKFGMVLEKLPNDGPSRFYLELCRQYREDPPGETWGGVIRLDKK